MKKNYFLTFLLTILISGFSLSQDLIITGLYDAGLSGGTPKGVELYVVNDIADLSVYGIGSANNGGGTDEVEYTFPADAVTAGTFIYVATEAANFKSFFGFDPNYTDGSMAINGDDAVELFMNGAVIDLFGDINTDGTDQDWEYLDGWAYRKSGKTANTTFTTSDWNYSGIDVFDGVTTNASAGSPFPVGTYSPTVSSDPTITVSGSVTGLDYYEGNGPSNEKEFTIEGANLTEDILITAPTNFEVSLTSGANFLNSVTLTQAGGNVATTSVYVRLKSTLGVNTYSGDITATSNNATNKTIAVSGEVSPADPQFYYTAYLDDFNYLESNGGPSVEQEFTVEGLFLTSDLTITAPANFEVSLTSGAGFEDSINVVPNSGTIVETTIYVRLKAGIGVSNYTGDITLSATNIDDKTITINGNVYGAATNSLVITGAYDGPLSGGTPKGVELYVLKDIADLSLFGLSSVTNGKGSSDGDVEFSFPADAVTAGTFIYVSTEETNFTTFFGIAPTYTTGVVSINGDDSIELYENGQIIDVFGDVDTDGSGETWDYLDGWAYRKSNTGPEGTTFTSSNWTYSGIDVFDGEAQNSTAATPFPIGTYVNNTASVRKSAIEGFATYPNPVTNNRFTISSLSSDKKQVSIYNVLGKRVLTTNFSGTKSNIDVSEMASGIYILKVTENGKIATKKLVIR